MDRTTRAGTAGSPGADPGDPFGAPGGVRVPVALGLLGVAVVASAVAGPWRPQSREPADARPTETPPPAPILDVEQGPDPFLLALEGLDVQPWDLTVLWVVLAALLSVALLVVAVHVVRGLPRPRPEGPPDDAGVTAGETVLSTAEPQPDLPTLRVGLRHAGTQLRHSERATDAVIAAWVALEDAAARSGVRRDPAWTPTEFTVSVLDGTPADRTATRTLLDLYLAARFGEEPMGREDVARAREAVDRLAADLVTGPEGPAR